MDKTETLKVLAALRGAYPNFYRGISKTEAEDTVNLWLYIFGRYPYQLVGAAVKSFIEADEKGFPPVPGQIAAKIRLITEPERKGEAEAWAKVAAAIKNGIYGYREEFEKLPPISQRIVGCPEQLRDWSMMGSDLIHSVVASNFQRAYRTASAREVELSKLPEDVKRLLGSASGNMVLEDGKRMDRGGEADGND